MKFVKALILFPALFVLANSPCLHAADMDPMHHHMSASSASAAQTYAGKAKINSVDRTAGRVNLSHDPIPDLGWPAMTMTFPVADKKMLETIQPGMRVAFDFVELSPNHYRIERIVPAAQ